MGVSIYLKATLMPDVTRILSAIEEGDAQAAEQLLPLVYDELRQLAAAKMARENPGQTLQATALVHEAYLRLIVGAGIGGCAVAFLGAVFRNPYSFTAQSSLPRSTRAIQSP